MKIGFSKVLMGLVFIYSSSVLAMNSHQQQRLKSEAIRGLQSSAARLKALMITHLPTYQQICSDPIRGAQFSAYLNQLNQLQLDALSTAGMQIEIAMDKESQFVDENIFNTIDSSKVTYAQAKVSVTRFIQAREDRIRALLNGAKTAFLDDLPAQDEEARILFTRVIRDSSANVDDLVTAPVPATVAQVQEIPSFLPPSVNRFEQIRAEQRQAEERRAQQILPNEGRFIITGDDLTNRHISYQWPSGRRDDFMSDDIAFSKQSPQILVYQRSLEARAEGRNTLEVIAPVEKPAIANQQHSAKHFVIAVPPCYTANQDNLWVLDTAIILLFDTPLAHDLNNKQLVVYYRDDATTESRSPLFHFKMLEPFAYYGISQGTPVTHAVEAVLVRSGNQFSYRLQGSDQLHDVAVPSFRRDLDRDRKLAVGAQSQTSF